MFPMSGTIKQTVEIEDINRMGVSMCKVLKHVFILTSTEQLADICSAYSNDRHMSVIICLSSVLMQTG